MNSFRPYLVNAFIEWLLDNDQVPLLSLNAAAEGVQVPSQHVDDSGHIVLNVSPDAVRNFKLDSAGIEFDTRFNGVSHRIKAPVTAIVGINGRGGSVGFAFGPELDSLGVSAEASTPDEPKTREKPKLRLVD